jgi:hypothetical protein
MAKAGKAKILSFSMDDRPGLLAEVTDALAAAKVNIAAVCAYSWDHTAYFDILADSVAKARSALRGLKIKPEESDAISIEMPNKVGELKKAAGALADAGINIDYMYGTASAGRSSVCILSTSDDRKALKILNK